MSCEGIEAAMQAVGISAFRGKQQIALEAVLSGKDVLYVFPTGFGKSAVYQTAALCSYGVTVVVSPLLGLQREQVEKLGAAGVPAIAACGGTLESVGSGSVHLVYSTPEQLHPASALVQFLEAERMHVQRIVVDEAHVVLDWEVFRCERRTKLSY
jgi:ATP-dependent DNA helicase RecQ